jgi:hypothetical protein
MESWPGESGGHRRNFFANTNNNTSTKTTTNTKTNNNNFKKNNYKEQLQSTHGGGPHDSGAIRVNPDLSAESVSHAILMPE